MTVSSIFDGLALASSGGEIGIRYPRRIHDLARARAAALAHRLEIEALDEVSWGLRHPGSASGCPPALKDFFADLNGYPRPYEPMGVRVDSAGTPLVSCIVIVNENAMFVREQLLPSLAAHAGGHPVEIVLVCNGADVNDPWLDGVRRVRSAWGAVAAGYNAGARASTGRYLAFLHDDCVIDDARWIDKCLDALARGADAVAGEFRRMDAVAGVKLPELPIAKSVPLFLSRDVFEEAGGYDEFHYVGYEDLDFTLALMRRGRRIGAADIRLRHFNGMSSTLKYCPVPGLAALYAMAALPRGAIRERFREFAGRGIERDGINYLRMALEVQQLYVLKKYREFLSGIDATAYASARSALERRVTTHCPFDPTLILPRFRELDRERWLSAREPA